MSGTGTPVFDVVMESHYDHHYPPCKPHPSQGCTNTKDDPTSCGSLAVNNAMCSVLETKKQRGGKQPGSLPMHMHMAEVQIPKDRSVGGAPDLCTI